MSRPIGAPAVIWRTQRGFRLRCSCGRDGPARATKRSATTAAVDLGWVGGVCPLCRSANESVRRA